MYSSENYMFAVFSDRLHLVVLVRMCGTCSFMLSVYGKRIAYLSFPGGK